MPEAVIAVTHTRGDTPAWPIKVYTPDRMGPQDISGYTIKVVVKPAIDDDDTDASAVYTAYIVIDASGVVTDAQDMTLGGRDPDTGELVSGAAAGVVTHRLSHARSDAIAPTSYVHDVQLSWGDPADPDVWTPIRSAPWTVDGDVARRIEP